MVHVDNKRTVDDNHTALEHRVVASSGSVCDSERKTTAVSASEHAGKPELDAESTPVPAAHARAAPSRLTTMLGRGKGVKQYDTTGAGCRFCGRSGHRSNYCTLRPFDSSLPARTPNAFVDRMLSLPRLTLPHGEDRKPNGMSCSAAESRLRKRGNEMNEENPCVISNEKRDRLRKQLGYWKALGADRTVLS